MKVLGVHIGHDSGASLVIDGALVADICEERFTRIKHYSGLPISSIEYCLAHAGCSMEDIDIIAIPSKRSVPELNYLFKLEGDKIEQNNLKGRMIEWAKRLNKSMLSYPPLYIKYFPTNHDIRIFHMEHHLAHAASAYYTSGMADRSIVITCDGVGDGFSICLWRAEKGNLTPLKKFGSAGSLGWFYSNVTEALGWWHGDGEGKTMGLAPYGSFEKTRGVLDNFYPKFANGELTSSHNFGTPYFWNEAGAFQWHFEEAAEIRKLIDRYGPEDIAAEAQRVLEEQLMNIIFPWLQKEKTKNLLCAGGVFLNVKLNQKIWYSGNVEQQWIYPNPGDAGLAAGAALYAYFKNHPAAQINRLPNLYLGPDYSNQEIEAVLKSSKIEYRFIEEPARIAAQQLADGKILAWFQGRMEAGPRALGSRSILMSAAKAENKDIINASVKFREPFRPFCPSLLDEKKEDYLVDCREEPFMITSFNVVPQKKNKVPAVVHADDTARPQTVTERSNKLYYQLIKHFGQLTGEYLVLNTSFNIKGEPIICHPRDAIRCFYDSGIDILIIGNYILEKPS